MITYLISNKELLTGKLENYQIILGYELILDMFLFYF